MRYVKTTMIFLCVLLMICCGQNTASESENTLWVLTEKSNSDGMNLQAEIIAERIEEAYPGLTVFLEILPTAEDEREVRLTQLRTQIMSGNGPDVYLLPTGSELISDEPYRDDNIPIIPVFPDVQQTMRNGLFMDISQYYNSDENLHPEALKQDVMSAGMIDGYRYVLPLRFDIPVIYTRPDICAAYGLMPELFEEDFLTIAHSVLKLKDAKTAAIGLKFPQELEALGFLLDYERGEVLVTEKQISEYLELCQYRNAISTTAAQAMYDKYDLERRILTMSDGHGCSEERWDSLFDEISWPRKGDFHHECFNMLYEYCSELYHWSICDIPIYTGYLSGIFDTVGVTRITGQKVDVYPLRDCNGAIHAYITYWGAIGANCDNPSIAYEFLRQFLDEEFQWDIYRPRASHDGPYWEWDPEPQNKGLVEDSLPVRTIGCIEPLWDNIQYQVEISYTSWVRKTRTNVQTIQKEIVDSEDIPELTWQIDCVSFPISLDTENTIEYVMSLLNEEDGMCTEVDIQSSSEEIMLSLWWHLAEG